MVWIMKKLLRIHNYQVISANIILTYGHTNTTIVTQYVLHGRYVEACP